MIIYNAFPQFNAQAEKIDESLSFLNLIIKPSPDPNCLAYTVNGEIFIAPHLGADPVLFPCETVHEGAHLTKDPILFQNYLDGILAIKNALSISDEDAGQLGNVASDIIIEASLIARKATLRDYRTAGVLKLYQDMKANNQLLPISRELFALYAIFHKIKGIRERTQLIPQIERILRLPDRLDRYVEIARLFLPLLRKEQDEQAQQQQGQPGQGQGQGQQDGKNQKHKNQSGAGTPALVLVSCPIKPDKEDLQKAIEKALRDSRDDNQLRQALTLMQVIATGTGADPQDITKLLNDVDSRLVRFYEAKAKAVTITIDFPKTLRRSGTRLGSKKWSLSNGIRNMDVPRTLQKFGKNIPLVTTRTAFIWQKVHLQETTKTPRPLTVSMDCSGSMQRPDGSMCHASDLQAVTLFAIFNAAERLNQKVGFTLWSDMIITHEAPVDPRQFARLKRTFLQRYLNGGTNTLPPVQEIAKHPDDAYFLVTDGDPDNPGQHSAGKTQALRLASKLSNVLLILTQPRQQIEQEWTDALGKDRTVTVHKMADLPKIALKKWREWFW